MTPISSTTISDAFHKLDPKPSTGGYLPDLHSFTGSQTLSAPVFPIKFVYKDSGTAPLRQHFVDLCPEGHILLLCPPEDSTNACFGGLLATAAAAQSVAGVVANGRVRDLDELEDSGLTIFAKGTSVCGQAPFLAPVSAGETVEITHPNGHKITIKSGDQLFADRNGVIVVDSTRMNEIEAIAAKSEQTDELCRQALAKGDSVKEVFAKYRGK
ncbi:RraA-like protein [Wallemia mellicola CBS 633.66]|uniref:RraA-like protein n=2 Tax=Wallemia mellicola TaxID=1708541 RepID=A0A4T0TZX0_9BASI|nr:RraA-like protein [Wallemia mellicola CBS 633.66]TIC07570.1 RraA-like protein [Wallemia mellicola]EIM21044.1 RraA-like protein [Wallemia mellicola CBS 633.66]TIC19396.1 RraA-like protein [Wallemia mellicola]TIC38142.1 RraA-like protein [Wallemia mellicola]TIC46385.1 RraA-like protein [Wallemia mellicola]|eukprot:XP_006959030.1 RraA-like protein [Wallemia mellicola CBS 633.66]